MFGYDAGILGGVQTTKPFLDAMGNPTGTYIVPMIASSYTLACAVCSLFVMVVGVSFGRRNCILYGDICVFIGGLIQSTSYSVPQIIVGRVLCGFGVGFITCTVPTYMSEMSIDEKSRGPAVAWNCSFLVTGVALAYWVDFGFTRLTGQVSWRVPIAGQCLFALTSGIGMLFLPDTPRLYFAKGRHKEAMEVLCRLHNTTPEDPAIIEVRRSILQSIEVEEEYENRLSLKSLFWDTTELRVGRRIRIAFFILSIQQMMGINILVYYTTSIFAAIGLSPFISSLLSAVTNTIFALGCFSCIPSIEKFGRRWIMLWSAVVLTVCMMIYVILIGLPHKTLATQWTAVVFVFLFEFIYGWGWVACPWLYGPEIAPLKYRHIGAAASCFGQWLFSFITVFAGGIAIGTIGWKIWIWQVLSCALAAVFIYFMCPETGGKTLEEIDYIFAKDPVAAALRLTRHNGDIKEDVKIEAMENEKDSS